MRLSPHLYDPPLQCLLKEWHNNARLQRPHARVLDNGAVEVDRALRQFDVAWTAIDIGAERADKALAAKPLLRVLRDFADKDENGQIATKLATVELDEYIPVEVSISGLGE